MNPLFEEHLKEVYTCFESNDTELALRRLTDSAFETQNPEIFKETLDYYSWIEGNKTEEENKEKAYSLLEKIRNAGVGINHSPENNNEQILDVRNVGKAYQKSGFRIQDISFSLNDGQITGLVGENGNGKTTLLRLLAAELEPDKGIVEYSFLKDKQNQYDLKTKLIYIEQRIPKWHGTLMDNLRFVLPFYGIKDENNHLWAELMIARLGLRPFRHLTWARISSGYRTRFELAKTLLRKPKILLLDEPLANLDIVAQQTILQDLKFMSKSITSPFGMILSSQHIYEVEKVSDNIIFIKNGKPQYQDHREPANTPEAVTEENSPTLILEIEVKCNREDLQAAFVGLPLEKIQFNGGVYMIHFSGNIEVSTVLSAMAAKGIQPNYFRDISQSSRRFFIN